MPIDTPVNDYLGRPLSLPRTTIIAINSATTRLTPAKVANRMEMASVSGIATA